MRRGVAGILVVLALVGAIAPSVDAGSPPPLDNSTQLAAMQRFEAAIPAHDVGGMITPLYYDKWPAVAADAKAIRMDAEPDSGNYTGVYLAAQSWRYAMAKDKLKRLGANGDPAQVTFWTAQRNEALARATEITRYYHVLVNIAEKWQTTFDPKIDQSKEPLELGWLDYGGGIIKGQRGLLMRACTPVDPSRPAYQDLRYNHAPTGKLLGPFAFEGKQWYCLHSTSRDSYAGTVFGLSVALDFIGTGENPALRKSLSNDLMAIADYAYKYYGLQPRPHGRVAFPGYANDLEGPISPLFFPQAPIQRLHLLQTARHAAHVVRNKIKATTYDALWAHEVAATIATGQVHLNSLFDASQPHDAYYKYQLELMSFFNVIRLERNVVTRELLRNSLSPMWASLSDDGNAFFEAMIYALTGSKGVLDLGVAHHREWLDYYAFHEYNARRGVTPFIHQVRCDNGPAAPGAPIEDQPLNCRPRAEVEMIVSPPGGGEPIVTTMPVNLSDIPPGTNPGLRANDPLPVGVRRLADFLWQKDPTVITGDHNVPWQGPSIDFLVSYWMLRYYTEVKKPPVKPLPVWNGPRFK